MDASRRSFFRNLAGALPASWLAMQTNLSAATAGSEDYWRVVKKQFPLADGLLYLNAANVCPASRPVLDRHQEFMRDFQADPSFQNRAKYDHHQESLRSKLAKHLGGVDADEVAITRNTSEGANIVVNGIDLKEGDEIVITSHNHPSSNDSWKVRARRDKLVIKEAPVPIPARSKQELLDSVAAQITPKTRVVIVTHLTSTTGNRYPVREIGELARKHNLWFHLDGAQTFGAFDIKLREYGCDSYAGSAHKWFMGPLEAGMLWVRKERHAELWPSIVTAGWADNLKGARKFEVYGQRDNPRIVAFEAAVDFIEMIGMPAAEARLKQLSMRLKEQLSAVPGVKLKTPMDWTLSGGVVKFQVAGRKTGELYDTLYAKHKVALAQTPSGDSEGLRFSPHIYNTMEEMDQAARIVRSLV